MRGALLVIVAIVLAGCASNGSEASAPADAPSEALQATASTGVLRCVIVDNAIIPLQDVMVFIDTGRIHKTGADGECGFDDLEPGPHMVRASKIGYMTVELTVDVIAGVDRPDMVRLVLEADPLTAPFTQVFKHDGHMVCSTSYSAACGGDLLSGQTGDSATGHFPIDAVPLWLTVEAVWIPSSSLGDQMILDIGSGEAGPENACCSKHGPSPIQHSLPGGTARQAGIGEQDLFARMFAYEINGTNPDRCLVFFCHGPGVVIQQDFELFVHAFHNWVPEAGYRFTEDGDPTTPA